MSHMSPRFKKNHISNIYLPYKSLWGKISTLLTFMYGLTAQQFLLTTCSAPHPPPWGIKMWDNGGVKSNIGNRLAEINHVKHHSLHIVFLLLAHFFLALSWCFSFLTWDGFHRIENTKRRVGMASVLEIPNNLDREHRFCWYQTTQSQRPTISCA